MNWESYEKKLLKNKKFRKIAAGQEPEYQAARSSIAAKDYLPNLDSVSGPCYYPVTKIPRINVS
jgi:hypothetical protein